MWEAAMILGGTGLLLGTGLAYVAIKVAVPPDERVVAVREQLPGANCGACGFPGCDGLAGAIVKGEAKPAACTAGGPAVIQAVSQVLGIEAELVEPKVVAVHCVGTDSAALALYRYDGVKDCRAAALLPGSGPKACGYGCLGLGTCAGLCPFGALSMNAETGLPVVNREKCTACGICVTACPRHVLGLIPRAQATLVACRSLDKGPVVRKLCAAGCLACSLCVRSCPQKAIVMENNLAVIDPALCDGCDTCVAKCPPKTIQSLSA